MYHIPLSPLQMKCLLSVIAGQHPVSNVNYKVYTKLKNQLFLHFLKKGCKTIFNNYRGILASVYSLQNSLKYALNNITVNILQQWYICILPFVYEEFNFFQLPVEHSQYAFNKNYRQHFTAIFYQNCIYIWCMRNFNFCQLPVELSQYDFNKNFCQQFAAIVYLCFTFSV